MAFFRVPNINGVPTSEIDAMLRPRLTRLFGNNGWAIDDIRVDGFTIEFRDRDTSFEDLARLAEEFGTKQINMGSESRDDGYCETCSSPYSVNLVRVDGVTRGAPPEQT